MYPANNGRAGGGVKLFFIAETGTTDVDAVKLLVRLRQELTEGGADACDLLRHTEVFARDVEAGRIAVHDVDLLSSPCQYRCQIAYTASEEQDARVAGGA